MKSINAAIKEGRSKVQMQPFGNDYTVSVYSAKARAWLQSGSMQFHIARIHASRNVVAQALVALGADETDADGEAYSTDGTGTIRERVIRGAKSLKVAPSAQAAAGDNEPDALPAPGM